VCPAGQAQTNEGSSACARCVAGKAQPLTDQDACFDCPAGQRPNIARGATKCEFDPASSSSGAGATPSPPNAGSADEAISPLPGMMWSSNGGKYAKLTVGVLLLVGTEERSAAFQDAALSARFRRGLASAVGVRLSAVHLSRAERADVGVRRHPRLAAAAARRAALQRKGLLAVGVFGADGGSGTAAPMNENANGVGASDVVVEMRIHIAAPWARGLLARIGSQDFPASLAASLQRAGVRLSQGLGSVHAVLTTLHQAMGIGLTPEGAQHEGDGMEGMGDGGSFFDGDGGGADGSDGDGDGAGGGGGSKMSSFMAVELAVVAALLITIAVLLHQRKDTRGRGGGGSGPRRGGSSGSGGRRSGSSRNGSSRNGHDYGQLAQEELAQIQQRAQDAPRIHLSRGSSQRGGPSSPTLRSRPNSPQRDQLDDRMRPPQRATLQKMKGGMSPEDRMRGERSPNSPTLRTSSSVKTPERSRVDERRRSQERRRRNSDSPW